MKKILIAVVVLLALSIDKISAQVNPTPVTISGFTGTAYLSSMTVSNSAIFSGPTTLPVLTTTQLSLRADPIGTTYWAQELTAAGALITNAYNICGSTAANVASYVYLAASTNALAMSSLGGACTK